MSSGDCLQLIAMVRTLIAPLLESDRITLPDFSDPLIILTLVAIGAWCLLLAAFVIATRPQSIEPAAPTMDLRGESPAIVNLLINRGARVTSDAVPATLIDLAAADYIDIEEYGDEVICRVKRAAPAGPIDPYAEMVLDHVKSEAENGVVAAQALTTGAKGKATAFWKRFSGAVFKDAEQRGLIENRWSRPMWGSLRLVGLGAGALVILVGARGDALEPAIMAVAVVGLSLNQALVTVFGQYKPSARGRDAAAHWMGVRTYLERNRAFHDATPGAVALWDRYMAYAASLGLAHQAVRALPMGADDDNRAWSAYSGEWRPVRVAYPRYRTAWGRSPLGALLSALQLGAIGGGMVFLAVEFLALFDDTMTGDAEAEKWTQIGAAVVVLVGVLLVLWGVRTLVVALTDAVTRIETEGEVIRARAYTSDKSKTRYYIAIDDGETEHVHAWRVDAQIYHRCREGSIVKATYSPRLGHVFALQPVDVTATTAV